VGYKYRWWDNIHIYIYTKKHKYIHIYLNMYIYVYMYVCMYVCMYLCMHVCRYTNIYIYIYIYTLILYYIILHYIILYYIILYYIILYYIYIHIHKPTNITEATNIQTAKLFGAQLCKNSFRGMQIKIVIHTIRGAPYEWVGNHWNMGFELRTKGYLMGSIADCW